MFCTKCGQKIVDGAAFCAFCGQKLGAPAPQARPMVSNCECCGAVLKRLQPNHYICEYCGSEYFTDQNSQVERSRIAEKELLMLFRQAADYEVRNLYWEELQCLLSAQERAGSNVVYLVKLGRAYRRNNLFSQAVECYEKARLINPDYPQIYANIGAVYIVTKQYALAEAPCRQGIELMHRNRLDVSNNDFAVAYGNLALAVGMLGRKEEAKQYLKIAEENGYQNGKTVRKMVGIKTGLFG